MGRLGYFLDSRKRYIEALQQARVNRGKRLWEIREARRALPTRQIKAIESPPEAALMSLFQQMDTVKTPEAATAQPAIEEIETPQAPEALFPQPEQPSIQQPPVRPSEYTVPKEAAIKINTEPTIIESAGGISQEGKIGPVSQFIFRLPDGREVGRANNLDDFFGLLRRGPLESILYHANEGHFVTWLEFKGHKKLAKKIKNIKGPSKKVRKRLLKIISRNR